MKSLLIILLIAIIIDNYCLTLEQIHLSLGTNETEMIVTWTIPEQTCPLQQQNAKVFYSRNNNSTKQLQSSIAEMESFKDLDIKYCTYRALLNLLKPNTTYFYWIEQGKNRSDIYEFKTLPIGNEWLPRFAIYGDLGYVNDQSLPYLKKDVEQNLFDAIFHVGDFAYDLCSENGWCGHNFMRTIEPIASKVPYMTCPGNHEEFNNFSHYDSRFSMIGDRFDNNDHLMQNISLNKRLNNHYHSMNIGPIHIIMFSTEYYYYTEYGWQQIEQQYRWLEKDLKRANENRHQQPWIIVMGHRPLYCLKMGDDSCDHHTMERKEIRQGIRMHRRPNSPRQYGLEDLFFKYGVDIQFYGHEHFYARLDPIYNYTILNGKHSKNPYDHPEGPIHITTGSAGNLEFHPPFNQLKNWVSCHFLDYGYTRLLMIDKYHIRLQQISDDQNGEILDEINIFKSQPQPQWML
uniref:Purple acid phosphatase n=1 Tax=Dermatophagoides pteronyssinus TaxID=6956 RepID=A0A6P6Y6E7_DERPT|nr:acid phosphatase type 7-like [Dermatophagoides pteronyssinus]